LIQYPVLEAAATIGITAPSSGVREDLHSLLNLSCSRMSMRGFNVICGETVWTQHKAKSAPAKVRADEFNKMMSDATVDIIMPPWGGELLIEILEHIDFDNVNCKWIMGYSDISVLLLAITLKTGIATAHGTSFIDLRGEVLDETTAKWQSVLSTRSGESILQHSSSNYQQEWKQLDSSTEVYQLTEPTYWKVVSNTHVKLEGRLLGGCIDVIRHLIGTPFGDVQHFQSQYIKNEPIIWYLENCELVTTDVRRSLVQMKLAGWFDHCTGVMFGRSNANQPFDNYTIEDVYKELADELQIPIIYDIDCGHMPPQITLINGAYAEIEVEGGRGSLKQYFMQ